MNRADAFLKSDESSRQLRPQEITVDEIPVDDCYQGIDLAPITLDSLGTWDVSGHAQRERDRLSYRTPKTLPGQGDY